MKRREFVQKSALATVGALAAPSLMGMGDLDKIKEFGVQVYTVRDNIQKNYEGTLKALRKIGYDYCEVFGYGKGKLLGKPVAEAKKSFEKAELEIKSMHVMPNTLENEWQAAVDAAAELGAQYIALAYLLPDQRKTTDQYKELIDLINRCAETSGKSGIQFLYHNHDFEFEKINGQEPYDLLLGQTDENLVKMELDLYWVRYAEKDPLKMFRENPGRFPVWHIKDMELAETRKMTEVGAGRIDWSQLFAQAGEAGMQHFFVEQDRNWATDPIQSTATSYQYLKALRY